MSNVPISPEHEILLDEVGQVVDDAQTVVVNLHEEPADIIIDRRSRWGNPFRIGSPYPLHLRRKTPSLEGKRMDRAAVIACYELWLDERLAADPDFLEPLRGSLLGCWCAPLPCHGDVIVEYLERQA